MLVVRLNEWFFRRQMMRNAMESSVPSKLATPALQTEVALKQIWKFRRVRILLSLNTWPTFIYLILFFTKTWLARLNLQTC
jgi:hypothetical protein